MSIGNSIEILIILTCVTLYPFLLNQAKRRVFSIPLERNREYMELGLFTRQPYTLVSLTGAILDAAQLQVAS